ncbi:MAG: hypothetical protein M3Q07_25965 [Pseudobdellovibrionaceae bacterium]|nr:hypothetical protein [Pseudobdellovibrionaceae bacterium]
MLITPRRSRLLIASCSLLFTSFASATDLQKIGCKEVEAIEAKCTEYDAAGKACDAAVADAAKAQVAAAKKDQDECKKKYSFEYVLKCKNEIKKATTLVNTPPAVMKGKVAKDLQANAESPCGKAEAIGKEQKLCKGPKKVISTMKANCIQDM